MTISVSEPRAVTMPAVHRRAIIVDGHCDTPYRMFRHNVHLDEHDTEAQADLRSLQESGITASFFAAYVPPFYADRGAAACPLSYLLNAVTTAFPVHSDGLGTSKSQSRVDAVSVVLTAAESCPGLTPRPQAIHGIVTSRGSALP